MRHHRIHHKSNLHPSGLVENSSYRFGRTELLLLLVLFIVGISVDSWFNHHQLHGQSANAHAQVSTSAAVNL